MVGSAIYLIRIAVGFSNLSTDSTYGLILSYYVSTSASIIFVLYLFIFLFKLYKSEK